MWLEASGVGISDMLTPPLLGYSSFRSDSFRVEGELTYNREYLCRPPASTFYTASEACVQMGETLTSAHDPLQNAGRT